MNKDLRTCGGKGGRGDSMSMILGIGGVGLQYVRWIRTWVEEEVDWWSLEVMIVLAVEWEPNVVSLVENQEESMEELHGSYAYPSSLSFDEFLFTRVFSHLKDQRMVEICRLKVIKMQATRMAIYKRNHARSVGSLSNGTCPFNVEGIRLSER
ncbi:hypothetical protein Tco_0278186 [Tanacetum coccineum]